MGNAPNPSGLCMCGCGQVTSIAQQTHRASGWVRGEHVKYVKDHYKGMPPLTGQVKNPGGMCVCGCGAVTPLAKRSDSRTGIFVGHPLLYLRGHHKRRTKATPVGYAINPDTGCWDWQLGLDKGYARTTRDGRSTHAHTTEWVKVNGPVPAGLELDHVCRNTRCVNPAHLEAVTPTENKRRSRATKLTREDVAQIKASSASQKELAQRFGVDPSNISHILRGDTWADIEAAT